MSNLTEAYRRRIESFHAVTEDFYDKSQPRDKNGRWTRARTQVTGRGRQPEVIRPTKGKVWSGISADPDNRKKPTPDPALRDGFKIEHDYDLDTSAHGKLAKRMYEADLGGGYHSHVIEAEPAGDYRNPVLSVRGVITQGTREVGTFERTVGQDENGIVVSHDELMINGSQHGKGIADRFNAHAIAEYQRMGVDRIVLSAGDTVGGYAWARQGFRLEGDEKYRHDFIGRQLDRFEVTLLKPVYRDHKKSILAQVNALRKANDAGEDIQPIHIASIGESIPHHETRDANGNTYQSWPGKDILLGTKWNGVYYFDANHPVTAAASDLAHAELRPAFKTAVIEYFSGCESAACAPPPAGTGGSRPSGPNRAARPGYGPTALRDVHLGGVHVTYHPKYPDDHPNPGEVVWAKVPFQDDPSQSKDRPVLVIGRIEGTTRLAALQLTSQIKGRNGELPIGKGSWDSQGRESALKLDRIIQIDASNYRREGSVFDRQKFDSVIGKLAAYWRTPVTPFSIMALALRNRTR